MENEEFGNVNRVRAVRLMLSAPSDLNKRVERQIQRSIREWNFDQGLARGIVFVPSSWKENAVAGYDSPQDMIDRQITDSAEALLAVFRDKIGSGVSAEKDAKTGTVSEIEKVASTHRDNVAILLDDSVRHVPRTKDETLQLMQLNEYIENNKNKFLYKSFTSPKDCRTLVFLWLSKCATSIMDEAEEKDSESSNGQQQLKGASEKKPHLRDLIRDLLDLIPDGKVTTYSDLCKVLGHPYIFAVTSVLLSQYVSAEKAGIVVHSHSGSSFYEDDTNFVTHDGSALTSRSQVFDIRNVPYTCSKDGKTLIVQKKDTYLDAEALRELLNNASKPGA